MFGRIWGSTNRPLAPLSSHHVCLQSLHHNSLALRYAVFHQTDTRHPDSIVRVVRATYCCCCFRVCISFFFHPTFVQTLHSSFEYVEELCSFFSGQYLIRCRHACVHAIRYLSFLAVSDNTFGQKHDQSPLRPLYPCMCYMQCTRVSI